jgi:hypothetical protein
MLPDTDGLPFVISGDMLVADFAALPVEHQAKILTSLRRQIDIYARAAGITLPSESATSPANVITLRPRR